MLMTSITKKRRLELRLGIPIEILPIEWIALVSLLVTMLAAGCSSLSLYTPSADSLVFAATHYLSPLVPPLIPVITAAIYYRLRNQTEIQHRLSNLAARWVRQLFALGMIVYVHFNFKLWAQLVHSSLYDTYYDRIDSQLMTVVIVLETVNQRLIDVFRLWPSAYHDLYVAMFALSFSLHSWRSSPKVFEKLVLSVALVLLIGGAAYAIAPALGPFIFVEGTNAHASQIQGDMLEFHKQFVASNGQAYSPTYFIAALAAMPSLHIAHVVLLLYFAFAHIRLLGWLYLLPSLFIVSEAVAAKWHYLIDLLVGAVLAAFCIYAATKLTSVVIPKKPRLAESA
jgi:membrane-associated phospholipid phosphatase